MQEVRCQLAWFRGGGVGAAPRTFAEIRTAVGDVDGETDSEQIPVVGDRRRILGVRGRSAEYQQRGCSRGGEGGAQCRSEQFVGVVRSVHDVWPFWWRGPRWAALIARSTDPHRFAHFFRNSFP